LLLHFIAKFIEVFNLFWYIVSDTLTHLFVVAVIVIQLRIIADESACQRQFRRTSGLNLG
jgi:hypothetical protein